MFPYFIHDQQLYIKHARQFIGISIIAIPANKYIPFLKIQNNLLFILIDVR